MWTRSVYHVDGFVYFVELDVNVRMRIVFEEQFYPKRKNSSNDSFVIIEKLKRLKCDLTFVLDIEGRGGRLLSSRTVVDEDRAGEL